MRNMLIAFLVAVAAAAGMIACSEGSTPAEPTTQYEPPPPPPPAQPEWRSTAGCLEVVEGSWYESRCSRHGRSARGRKLLYWRNTCDFRVRVRYATTEWGRTLEEVKRQVRSGIFVPACGASGSCGDRVQYHETELGPNEEREQPFEIECPGNGYWYITWCSVEYGDNLAAACRSWDPDD